MRYLFICVALVFCTMDTSVLASSGSAGGKGLSKVDVKVESLILEKVDFTNSVTNLPETYKAEVQCRCTSEVRAPQVTVYPSSGIETINTALKTYAEKFIVSDKTNYDNCQSSNLDYTTVTANMRFVSMRFTHSLSCGAYPVSKSEGLTYDSRTGERIAWEDLVNPKKLHDIESSCAKQYSSWMDGTSEDPDAPDGEDRIVPPDDMFSLKNKNMSNAFVITQDQKLVLLLDEKFWPHAAGAVDCTVPKSALKPLFFELFI